MTKYDNSKIYKIEPLNIENEGDIYIGSTTKHKLSERMANHRYSYRKWKNGNYSLFCKMRIGINGTHRKLQYFSYTDFENLKMNKKFQ